MRCKGSLDASSLLKKGINSFILAFPLLTTLSVHINTADGRFGGNTTRRFGSLNDGQRVCTLSTLTAIQLRVVHMGMYAAPGRPDFVFQNEPLQCVLQGLQLHRPECVHFSSKVRRWITSKDRDSYLPMLIELFNNHPLSTLKKATITLEYPPDGLAGFAGKSICVSFRRTRSLTERSI